MLEAILQVLLKTATERATSALEDALARENKKRTDPAERIRAKVLTHSTDAVPKHMEYVLDWCRSIRIADMQAEKTLERAFVELDTFIMPMSTHADVVERTRKRRLLAALAASNRHCAILGAPGSGKTTSIKKVCAEFFVKDKVLRRYNFPILISLRDLLTDKSGTPISTKLQQILLISVTYQTPAELAPEVRAQLTEAALLTYIDELHAAIFLDGFDEVPLGEHRTLVLRDIERLVAALRHTKIVITSRSPDFRFELRGVEKLEIAPLEEDQISTFARKWLAKPSEASDFVEKVTRSPIKDMARRPLTVAFLCAIYERVGDIPEKPKSVYERVVRLLLEQWDIENNRGVRKSRYTGFDPDAKRDFLAHLAFELTSHHQVLRFDFSVLHQIYERICRDHTLPPSQYATVILEIESHSGLIIESGFGHYEFAHKSIQEYLGAFHIMRMPDRTSLDSSITALANEVAVAAALFFSAIDFLALTILRPAVRESLTPDWCQVVVQRLIAERAELKGQDPRLTTIILLDLLTGARLYKNIPAAISGALPENPASHLQGYYVLRERGGQSNTYAKCAEHRRFFLPEILRIPTELDSPSRTAQ